TEMLRRRPVASLFRRCLTHSTCADRGRTRIGPDADVDQRLGAEIPSGGALSSRWGCGGCASQAGGGFSVAALVGAADPKRKKPSKYSITLVNPWRSGSLGTHPSNSSALLMSGRRCFGSSVGSGRWTIFDEDPARPMVISASSLIVNSTGFP